MHNLQYHLNLTSIDYRPRIWSSNAHTPAVNPPGKILSPMYVLFLVSYIQIANNYHREVLFLQNYVNSSNWKAVCSILQELCTILQGQERPIQDRLLSSHLIRCFFDLQPANADMRNTITSCLQSCLECCHISEQDAHMVVQYFYSFVWNVYWSS